MTKAAGSHYWDNGQYVHLTKEFIGMSGLKYYDVEVRIIAIADNAVVVQDAGGMQRVALWKDLSFASEYIARQNPGAIVMLKIRAWQ